MPNTTPNDPITDLLTFIDRSPSPWHAGANLATRLGEAGFAERREAAGARTTRR